MIAAMFSMISVNFVQMYHHNKESHTKNHCNHCQVVQMQCFKGQNGSKVFVISVELPLHYLLQEKRFRFVARFMVQIFILLEVSHFLINASNWQMYLNWSPTIAWFFLNDITFYSPKVGPKLCFFVHGKLITPFTLFFIVVLFYFYNITWFIWRLIAIGRSTVDLQDFGESTVVLHHSLIIWQHWCTVYLYEALLWMSSTRKDCSETRRVVIFILCRHRLAGCHLVLMLQYL